MNRVVRSNGFDVDRPPDLSAPVNLKECQFHSIPTQADLKAVKTDFAQRYPGLASAYPDTFKDINFTEKPKPVFSKLFAAVGHTLGVEPRLLGIKGLNRSSDIHPYRDLFLSRAAFLAGVVGHHGTCVSFLMALVAGAALSAGQFVAGTVMIVAGAIIGSLSYASFRIKRSLQDRLVILRLESQEFGSGPPRA